MKKSQGAIIGVLIMAIILITSYLYYDIIYTKTPQYSLYMVAKSIKEKNEKAFFNHVDVRAIVYNMVDRELKVEKMDSNPFAIAMANLIKPALVDKLIDTIQADFTNKKTPSVTATKNTSSNHTKKSNITQFLADPDKNKKIKVVKLETTYLNKENTIASVYTILENKENQKTIELTFIMIRMMNREWKLIDIQGLTEEDIKEYI